MTREEIQSLKPSKFLNDLVADKVMGWETDYEYAYYLPERDGFVSSQFHQFSVDISAAWEVVEKMRERKIYLDIRVWPDEYQVLPHLDENNKLIERAVVRKKRLPEAVCIAALLAMKGSEEA